MNSFSKEYINFCLFCQSPRMDVDIELSNLHDLYFNSTSEAFGFYRCLDCDSLALNPRVCEKDSFRLYENYYTIDRKSDDLARVSWLKRLVKSLKIPLMKSRLVLFAGRFKCSARLSYRLRGIETISGAGTVLDYGCGDGDWIRFCSNFNFDVHGVEFDHRLVSSLVHEGLSIQGLEQFAGSSQRYDLITLNQVLEHVYDPRELLQTLSARLLPGGSIWLSVPNQRSISARISGGGWRGYEVPRHVGLPSMQGVRELVSACGLKVVFMETTFHQESYFLDSQADVLKFSRTLLLWCWCALARIFGPLGFRVLFPSVGSNIVVLATAK